MSYNVERHMTCYFHKTEPKYSGNNKFDLRKYINEQFQHFFYSITLLQNEVEISHSAPDFGKDQFTFY